MAAVHELSAVLGASDPAPNVTTVAGGGGSSPQTAGDRDDAYVPAQALFNNPYGLAADYDTVYVCDLSNRKLRGVNAATGATTTLAGGTAGNTDAVGTNARFDCWGLAADAVNGHVYMADYAYNRIKRYDTASGVVATIAGGPTAAFIDGAGTVARFNTPRGVAYARGGIFTPRATAGRARARSSHAGTAVRFTQPTTPAAS